MSKYKVGDVVKVRDDLKVDNIYGNVDFAEGMREFLGKEVTIADIFNNCYYIKETNNYDWHTDDYYEWTDEMFEDNPQTEETTLQKINTRMLFKIRECGLCILLDRESLFECSYTNELTFYNKDFIGNLGGIAGISCYTNNLKHSGYKKYDIIAYKQYNSQSEALGCVLNNIEPESWDWEEKWIPVEGEYYYVPAFRDIGYYASNQVNDFTIKHNLYFKTPEEATAKRDQLLNIKEN